MPFPVSEDEGFKPVTNSRDRGDILIDQVKGAIRDFKARIWSLEKENVALKNKVAMLEKRLKEEGK